MAIHECQYDPRNDCAACRAEEEAEWVEASQHPSYWSNDEARYDRYGHRLSLADQVRLDARLDGDDLS